jgi:hypothetical protein
VRLSALRRFSGFHAVQLHDGAATARGCGAGAGGCPFTLFHHKTRSHEECVAKARDARLGEANWRRKAGLAQCERAGYVVHDARLANSSVARCVADNAARLRGAAQRAGSAALLGVP